MFELYEHIVGCRVARDGTCNDMRARLHSLEYVLPLSAGIGAHVLPLSAGIGAHTRGHE